MSVTFGCREERPGEYVRVVCLCAQEADRWGAAFRDPRLLDDPAVQAELRGEADPECEHCEGSGVELEQPPDPAWFNVCNETARALFGALGVPSGGALGMLGELPLPEARRALIRARNRPLAPFLRAPSIVRGGPVFRGDGLIALSPLRSVDDGLSEEDLRHWLDRFGQLVEEAARRGAGSVCWG